MENETAIQDWLISRFIARPDRFAIQGETGNWYPARSTVEGIPYDDRPLQPWNREILAHHLSGVITAGHYMLSEMSTVKLIAFDIDFMEQGFCPANYSDQGHPENYEIIGLRDEWHNRNSFHRSWLKTQLRMVSHKIAGAMFSELEIPVACAYSGNKGVHVYGFTGELPAAEARMAAEMVMKSVNAASAVGTNFQLSKGSFEWTDCNDDLDFSFKNVTVEVFPKQDEVAPESFGNLMALPLGVNRKHPEDPKFFLDMRSPMNEFVPADPLWALTTLNPWED